MSSASPTPSATVASLRAADVSALQRGLAAEHAAVWAYGVVGANLDGTAQTRARACLDEHLAWRNRVSALLSRAGAEPVAARPAYALPSPVADAASARALATRVEQAAAAVWADVLAGLSPDRRGLAADALRETALRWAGWTGRPAPFPGLPERS